MTRLFKVFRDFVMGFHHLQYLFKVFHGFLGFSFSSRVFNFFKILKICQVLSFFIFFCPRNLKVFTCVLLRNLLHTFALVLVHFCTCKFSKRLTTNEFNKICLLLQIVTICFLYNLRLKKRSQWILNISCFI